jgi:hypothetical protein
MLDFVCSKIFSDSIPVTHVINALRSLIMIRLNKTVPLNQHIPYRFDSKLRELQEGFSHKHEHISTRDNRL